jgi:hypothetical protein
MSIPKNLADCRVLVVYPVALSQIKKPFISEDLFFLTTVPEANPRVISFPFGSWIDMEVVIANLPRGWYPDIFIAYVNSFFYLVPVNVAALRCPKILLLGDTHHGLEPLQKIISYTQQEQYDFHVVNFDRHHLWYYWLAGIKNLYWLPTLLVTPPSPNFIELPYQQKDITDKKFQDKVIFVGNFNCHPQRRRIVEYLSHHIPEFFYGQISLQDSFKAFNQASISLNISLNGDANMRNFEIISAGGFLLSERLSDEAGINLILEEGKDYEAFSDPQELTNKIKHFLVNSSLSYRQASYQKYLDLLSTDQSILRLQNLIQGQDISDIFTTKSVRRIQHFSSEKLSLVRIQLYELIQNIHRVWDQLIIAVDMQVDFAYAIDFLDLHRVTIIVNEDTLSENVIEYLTASNNLSRVKMTQNYLEEKFNVIITSTCEPTILHKLIQRNALVISTDYQGLTVACGYQDFVNLQWDQSASSSDFFVVNGNIDGDQLSLIDFITWYNLPVTNNAELLASDLDLRNINLLLCPDWQQAESLISDRLISALIPVFTSDQVEQIALIICIEQDQEETASFILSTVMMNILMEENITVMGEPGIVFIDRANSLLWSAIFPQVQYRLSLGIDKIEILAEINSLPLWTSDKLG